VETYLHHAVRDQPGLDREASLQHVSRLVDLIRQANEIEFNMCFNGTNNLQEITLSGLNTEIELEVDLLPEPALLDDITITCNPDTFLEVLMGNVRNTLISFQAWISKIKACALSRSLNLLKSNYTENCDEIFRLESELVSIRDADLAIKIKDIKLFENLHNEKPSPLFLQLIKKSSKDDLSSIRDDNNQQFETDSEREAHIVKFYERLYKAKKNRYSIIMRAV
jgi:hypothetical protein